MSIRRLSVIIFVRVTVTSCYLLRGVPVVAKELLLSSSRRLHRLSTNLTACTYIRVVRLTVFLIMLYSFIICQFAALFPLVTSQAWLRSDVLEPQPGVTAGERRMFLALGVLDRFPAVPSASLHRLGLMSWLCWFGS